MSNYDMDEIERQRERELRSRGIRTVKEDRYDDHIVGQPLLEPDAWIYNTNNCTEKIEIDISDQDVLQLTMIAHDRDITLNHLINEVLHDKIQRDLLQHSR
jgi:hypothetical protein